MNRRLLLPCATMVARGNQLENLKIHLECAASFIINLVLIKIKWFS